MRKSCFAVALVTLFALRCLLPTHIAHTDQWFDSYERISWEEEKIRLDNLAMFLDQNPKMIGYIAFYGGKDLENEDLEERIDRVRDHLERARKIDSERIVLVRKGKIKKARTILQPVEKDRSPPKFPG